MHTNYTTDLSLIVANLKSTANHGENVVLIETGSLNPVHRSHIGNLVKVKEYLQRTYNCNVVGGYLSPTHDDYVDKKLKAERINGQHRIEMCRKAINEANQQNWLSVDMAECMAHEFIDLVTVTQSLRNFINENIRLPKPIRVVYVAGLDLFNRCWGMKRLRENDMDGVAVVYRSGVDNGFIESMKKNGEKKIFYVAADDNDNNESDISSTLIRKQLQNNQDCDHLTYKSVLDHMKQIS